MGYFIMLACLWLAFLFSAAIFQEPFLKKFFLIGQGMIIGHALTLWFARTI